MAITANYLVSAMLMLGLLTMVSLDFTVAETGVCYGRLGDDLPSAAEVVALYKKYNIQRMRTFDPDKPTLQALSGSNIELSLGVPNNALENLASCQDKADTWVQDYIVNYPGVKFTHVVVGNEVSPLRDSSPFVSFVLPAMQNIYNAICAAGLGGQIKVSTGIETGVLEKSYPPNEGVFKSNVTSYLNPIIQYLMNTGAPLFVSIYPYFAYINDKKNVNLQYALLQPDSGICLPDGTRYDNLFYAIVDAMYAALEKSISGSGMIGKDGDKPSTPQIKGSESGWPTDGGDASTATSVRNARIYNNNLIRIVKNGTPKRPGKPIETYIFAMFDENRKEGPEHEKHFGLFRPNGQPKYSISFN